MTRQQALNAEARGEGWGEEVEEVTINLEVIGIDDATEKAERLIEILKEAKTLADELACYQKNLSINSEII